MKTINLGESFGRTDAAPVARGDEAARVLQRIRAISWWMDRSVRIPGVGYRVGLDGLIGLIPGVGDLATTAVSVYVIHLARRHGISNRELLQMLGNVALDLGIGAVPLVGDLFDFMWKSNTKNLQILERHLQERQRRQGAFVSDKPLQSALRD